MLSRGRVLVAPAYLFACLILGGSVQGIWQNMVLQLAGVAIIAWAALDRSAERLPPAARQLLLLAIAAIAVVAVQLIPMPPSLWTHIGPREQIAGDLSSLGIALPWQPLSVAPAASLDALFRIVPALAMVCAMVPLRAYVPRWLAVALFAATLSGIALGAMQIASSGAEVSPLYLYADTSVGRAVGFFANADHMATLLVISLPFLAATVAAARSANMQRYSAVIAIAVGLAILILIGLAMNGSLAAYSLGLPVLAGSALIVLRPGNRARLWLFGLALLLLAGSIGALEKTAIGSGRMGTHASTAVQSRAELLLTTSRAASDFLPWGSGLGSFQSVYPLYEDPLKVNADYVIHAHNDYAEVALELGIAGIVLMILFLAWWAAAVWRTWRTAEAGPFARAATIASAAVLVHSFVDFPLRTAAISVCFGMCLALLADSRAAPPREKSDLRRKRHVEFK
jgi:O-antigen ligase